MPLDKASEFFNREKKQWKPRTPSDAPRARYLRVPVGSSAIVTVLSDDFVPVTAGQKDLGGMEAKYDGMQLIVKNEQDSSENVWSVPKTVGKTLTEKMRELNTESPRGLTLKLKHLDQYTYQSEVVTPGQKKAEEVAADVTNELLNSALETLRGMNGTLAQPDGIAILLKVKHQLKNTTVGAKVVDTLVANKKITFADNRLRVL